MKKKRKFSEGLLNDEAILEKLQIVPGQIILDAGCGNGYMAKKFSVLVGKTGKVYALDKDIHSINNLENEITESNVEVLFGDITQKTKFKNSSIDLIYLSTVFHIFSQKQIISFEKEVTRILKIGGKLAIININMNNTNFGPPIEMRITPDDLKNKLSLSPGEHIAAGEHFYMQLFVKTEK